MIFSQLLVLLEAQWLLSCAEHDRDIRTQTSAEHSLAAHYWPHHNIIGELAHRQDLGRGVVY